MTAEKIRKILCSAIQLSAICTCTLAQPFDADAKNESGRKVADYEGMPPAAVIEHRIDKARERIEFRREKGHLTQRQVEALKAELAEIARLEQKLKRGGLRYTERMKLHRKLDRLEYRTYSMAYVYNDPRLSGSKKNTGKSAK